MPAKLTPEKFWSMCEKRENSCWEWTRCLHKDGYGQLSYHRKFWLAHRLAWHLARGPIPKGICVCHKCDNPKCINPDHLFIGSHAENMSDMKNKGRRKNINSGELNGRAKISASDAAEIRNKYQSGKTRQVDLAAEYGIAQTVISLIVRGKIWKQENPNEP